MLSARSRAWYSRSPRNGSTATVMIFSGVLAATSSMSTPPSLEAITTTRRLARSSTMPR